MAECTHVPIQMVALVVAPTMNDMHTQQGMQCPSPIIFYTQAFRDAKILHSNCSYTPYSADYSAQNGMTLFNSPDPMKTSEIPEAHVHTFHDAKVLSSNSSDSPYFGDCLAQNDMTFPYSQIPMKKLETPEVNVRTDDHSKSRAMSTGSSTDANLHSRLENTDEETQEFAMMQLPSWPGSANHPDTCRPCSFAFTLAGCDKGNTCDFCHFTHKKVGRLNKKKRHRMKDLVARKNAQACQAMTSSP
jgi:hypothetical protein